MPKHTLAEVVRSLIEDRLIDVHTSMVCRVQKFDAATQRAELVPLVKSVTFDPRDGAQRVEDLPVLPSVPVAYPRTTSGLLIYWPLEVGDFVRVHFAERPTGQFLATGKESDPGDLTTHGLDGAVCYPGEWPNDQPLGVDGDDKIVIGADGGVAVRAGGPTVQVGAKGGAFDPVAMAPATKAEITALRNSLADLTAAFNAHMHATAPTGSPSAPTPNPSPLIPAAAPAAVGEVASSTLEAE